MAAAPQISAKAMGMIDFIHERMNMIVPHLDDIRNLMQSNNPKWRQIEEKIAATELEILDASQEVNELKKLANKEGFPGDMRASIGEQAGQLSDIFRSIASIKGHASYAGRGDAAARAAMQTELDALLLQARGTQILVASFHQQVGQHGGSRKRKRSKRSLRLKRSKRSKRTKRKQRTHRKI